MRSGFVKKHFSDDGLARFSTRIAERGATYGDFLPESIPRISFSPWRTCLIWLRLAGAAENGRLDCFFFPSDRRCWRAPAIVKPSSYRSFLMRSTFSTSGLRYMRWPVLLL